MPHTITTASNLDSTELPESVVASLFDRNPLPMWFYDLESLAFLAVNDSAIERYGYSRQEFLQMTIADIRPEEDLPDLRANIAAVDESLDRAGIWRHIRKDGSVIDVEITSYPISFGKRRAELVIAYDVSHQVSAEEKYRLLVQNQTDLVVKVDPEGRFQFVSPSYCRAFGKQEDELLGKAFMPLVHEDDRDSTAEAMEALSQPPYTCYLEQRALTVDGWRWLAWADRAVVDEQKRVKAIVGTGRDITERKLVELELQRSEQNLKSIFRAAPIGIGLVIERVFHEVNETFCSMTGYAREELLGQNARLIYASQAEYERVGREKYAQIQACGSGSVETRFQRKDGSLIDVLLSSTLVDAANPTVGATFTALDITARKRAEVALTESEARLQNALEASATGTWDWDVQRDQVFGDARILSMFGLDASKASVGIPLSTFIARIHPQDRDRVSEKIQGALETGEPYAADFRLIGEECERWVHARGQAQFGENGEPERFPGAVSDITKLKALERRSLENERRLSTLMGNLPGIAFRCLNVPQWTMEYVSEGSLALVGYPPEALIGNAEVTYRDLIHPDDRQHVWNEIQKAVGAGDVYRTEYRLLDREGCEHWVWEQGRCSSASGDEPAMLEGLIIDVTDRRRAEDKLRVAATIFGSTAEGVVVTDLDGTIRDINQAFTRITGYDREEVLGQNPRILKSGRHDESYYQAMYHALEEVGSWRDEIWNRRKDGGIYQELLTISTIKNAEGASTGYVGVLADITELKETHKRLDHLAHHDPLTDLPNRLLLGALLQQSLVRAEREQGVIAVFYVDVDRLKTINDGFGHPAGDVLLQQLAQRLVSAVRSDDAVARIGSDEFVVVLEHVHCAENAALVAQKMIRSLSSPFLIEDQEIHATVSMGITVYPDDGEDAEALISNADAAMYRAKDDGRNSYHFYTKELTASAFEHVLLETSLRSALEKDELRLVYQPQYDLSAQTILGMEALLRWHHPEIGVVSPGRFIPVAEQSGLIRNIGEWVLRTACQQGRQWLDKGLLPGRIAVNIAGPQIKDERFSEIVLSILEESGMPARQLALEVTEGFVMYGVDAGVAQLRQLRQAGVEIAIDDFGTGYSSLRYIKELPIDKLKVDQSFVRGIPDDTNDAAISSAVIAMGRALDLRVIAEGVETDAQADFLRDQRCAEAQGFLFSKPLSPVDMTALLAEQAAF